MNSPLCIRGIDEINLRIQQVARMERSEIRDFPFRCDAHPAFRGACHRAALRADPLAHAGYGPSHAATTLMRAAARERGLARMTISMS